MRGKFPDKSDIIDISREAADRTGANRTFHRSQAIVAPSRRYDLRALARERNGAGAADSAARASHQRKLSPEAF